MDNRDRIRLHEAWWRRENERPLVDNFTSAKFPYPELDFNVPVEQIGERKRANALALGEVTQDLLVTQRIDFGTAFLPALAGAGFNADGATSWNTPIAERCADVELKPFEPSGALWDAYAQRRTELLKHWSWDTYLPGHTNYIGPLDMVAALIGSQNLLMQMYDDPDGVGALSLSAADFINAVMLDDINALRSAGPHDGVTDIFQLWMPGNGSRLAEDFSVMVGPDQTTEFIVPAARRTVRGIDSVFYHTHSAAFRNVPIMAGIGGRVAVEFGTDPGRPELEDRISTVRGLQERNIPVQYGSWKHPLTDEEIRRVVEGLDARGLILRFQTESAEESRRLYERIKGLG